MLFLMMTENTKWYVYIIETQKGSLYTGITTDVRRRFDEHCNSPKGSKYLRVNKPKRVVYEQTCENRSEASKRECQIKKFTKKQKEELIKDYADS